MKAVLLCAGQGTRLRPFTNDRPKCLVELRGRSLLDYQLAVMRECGIEKIAIVTGYRSDRLDSYSVVKYKNERYQNTNMVYSLFCAAPEFEDDVIISYSDIVYEPRILRAVMESSLAFAVAIDLGWSKLWEWRGEDPLSTAETLKMDSDGRILEIGRKPLSLGEIEGQYLGLIKIGKDAWPRVIDFYRNMDRDAEYDGKDFDNMYMTSFIQAVADCLMPVYSVPIEHGWVEVDTCQDLRNYENAGCEIIDFANIPADF